MHLQQFDFHVAIVEGLINVIQAKISKGLGPCGRIIYHIREFRLFFGYIIKWDSVQYLLSCK